MFGAVVTEFEFLSALLLNILAQAEEHKRLRNLRRFGACGHVLLLTRNADVICRLVERVAVRDLLAPRLSVFRGSRRVVDIGLVSEGEFRQDYVSWQVRCGLGRVDFCLEHRAHCCLSVPQPPNFLAQNQMLLTVHLFSLDAIML